MTAVLTNVAGNLVLIPLLGIEGAALGTALSFLAGTAALILFARRLQAWNLLESLRRARTNNDIERLQAKDEFSPFPKPRWCYPVGGLGRWMAAIQL
jgi:hypothetical protein